MQIAHLRHAAIVSAFGIATARIRAALVTAHRALLDAEAAAFELF